MMRYLSLALLASLIAAVVGSGSSRSTNITMTKYNALFGFGDSMTETGNICLGSNSTELDALTCTHPPYGMTYFGKPSCRWCNGRVVIDFTAQALGFPLLPPLKSQGKDFRRGANMAITGDCKEFLKKSLFQFGGFGGNDYNVQLLELALTVQQGMKNTPMIINAIVNGVERLIALGARQIVVPGIHPTGCLPLFLSLFASSSNEADLDQYGCMRSYNRLTEYHNTMLQKQVEILQRKHRSARIMYADYYQLYYQMVQQPQKFGFSNPFEACCGAGGGKYNFDITKRCGMPGATIACRDPSARLSWDGIHPSEAANKFISDGWLHGPYCTPPILG
ncbi:hypothetical protein EJB05_12686 [Eragrostis curvula]|uniref:Uncharacterized protein n=1 Tax=Eragrostis curvula TaxID=38414 RepID=A0A5J9VUL5_9POAL|nr:hypothetical protein EJB05_12686 [Eragrostis curvula]